MQHEAAEVHKWQQLQALQHRVTEFVSVEIIVEQCFGDEFRRNFGANFCILLATFWVHFDADGRCKLWVAGGWVVSECFGSWTGDSALDSGILRFAGQCV